MTSENGYVPFNVEAAMIAYRIAFRPTLLPQQCFPWLGRHYLSRDLKRLVIIIWFTRSRADLLFAVSRTDVACQHPQARLNSLTEYTGVQCIAVLTVRE